MRRLQFKFLSQIRISGWDFGSSARAMNQAGGFISTQADLEKVSRSTTERKSMSTKTTIKRIALVAVSALGLGVLSSIAPANAVAGTITGVSVGTPTPARVAATTSVLVTTSWAAASDIATSDTFTVTAQVSSAPSGSAMKGATIVSNSAGAALTWAAYNTTNGTTVSNTYTDANTGGIKAVKASGAMTATSVSATAKSVKSLLQFVPDVAGTYQILIQAGTKSAYWTFATVGAPASVTLSSLNSTTSIAGTTGSRVKVVLKDAAGNVTVPDSAESLSITDSSSSASPSATSLAASDFATYGYAIFYVEDDDNAGSTAYTDVVTVSGDGTTISASVNSNITISFKPNTTGKTDLLLGDGTTPDTSAGAATPDGWDFSSDDVYYASSAGSAGTVMIASTASDTAAKYYWVTVTDTSGDITGIAGTVLDMNAVQAAADTSGYATLTVSTALADGDSVTFGLYSSTDTVQVTGQDPALSVINVITNDQRVAVSGAVSITAQAVDQFNQAIANAAVAISVSGRNTVAAKNYVTNADGYVTYSYTDAGTASTVNTVDTVLFDISGTDDTSTITFGAYTVGTVTVTGGATADTVAYPATGATTAAISTAKGGAAGATTTFTATVKDANGNLLSGVPVTWTVDKSTAGITKTLTSDSSTCITASAGTCTTTVFSWAAPSKVTVTATAGGKTGTGYQNFVNASGDARVLSATSSGNVVTAKVVDRYGNVVSGVKVTAKTSNGYFGSGATSTSGDTDENGQIGFAVTGGNATVTLTVDSATYGQTDDAAGYVGTSAVTAAVAGTTTGVGASLAPAGVNKVVLDTTAVTATSDAVDAANEATDAANAATDAANAAAEAADAATAAAQDAQAAVAALASQVADLIAGIKAQITALTNLVIKIQKKVKA